MLCLDSLSAWQSAYPCRCILLYAVSKHSAKGFGVCSQATCRIIGDQSVTTSTLLEPEKNDNRMTILYFTIDRDTHHLLPPSIEDHLPEDHLARLVVEITDRQRGALCFNFSSAHAGVLTRAYQRFVVATC
jgi:hypothetical protein